MSCGGGLTSKDRVTESKPNKNFFTVASAFYQCTLASGQVMCFQLARTDSRHWRLCEGCMCIDDVVVVFKWVCGSSCLLSWLSFLTHASTLSHSDERIWFSCSDTVHNKRCTDLLSHCSLNDRWNLGRQQHCQQLNAEGGLSVHLAAGMKQWDDDSQGGVWPFLAQKDNGIPKESTITSKQ